MGRAAHNTARKLFSMEAVGSVLLDMFNDHNARTIERQRHRVEVFDLWAAESARRVRTTAWLSSVNAS